VLTGNLISKDLLRLSKGTLLLSTLPARRLLKGLLLPLLVS
jgi:hypothetical protein